MHNANRFNLTVVVFLFCSMLYSQESFEHAFQLKSEQIMTDPRYDHNLFVHDINNNGHFEILSYYQGLECFEFDGENFEKLDLPVLELYRLNALDNNGFLDWDNDGDLDVVAIEDIEQYSKTKLLLFENNGSGSFSQSSLSGHIPLPDNLTFTKGCDYNFDGLLDLFLYGSSPLEDSKLQLYKRQSYSDFTIQTIDNSNNGYYYPNVIKDVNNDKIADLVQYAGYLDGNNNFAFVKWCSSEEDYGPYGGLYGDFNNDGIHDYINEYDLWLSNKETGCYQKSDSGLSRGELWAFDWNNDGWTDVIRRHNSYIYFYANDKSGGFTATFQKYAMGGPRGLIAADLDQDGDLDLIMGLNDISYFENISDTNRGIQLKLTKANPNYSFYNLNAKVFVGESVQVKQYKIDNAIESGQSIYFHFGLGTETKIDSIQVNWPSGLTQTLKNIPYSTRMEIIEDFTDQPKAVTTLNGTVLFPDKALLEWENDQYGEERFIVQRKTASDAEYISIDTIPANSIRYDDNTYLAGQTVFYKLVSDSKLGRTESNEVVLAFGDALPPPGGVPILEIDSISYDLVILAWNTIEDASEYIIERYDHVAKAFKVIDIVNSDILKYSDTSVLESRSYLYRIMASNHGSYSSPSNEMEVRVPNSLFKLSERIQLEPHRLWRIMDYNGDGDKDLYFTNSDFVNADLTATYVYENTDGTLFNENAAKIAAYIPHVYDSYPMPFYDFNKDNLPEMYSSPDTINSINEKGEVLFFADSLEIEYKYLLAWAGYLNDDLSLDYIYRDYSRYPTANVYIKLSDSKRKGGDLLFKSSTYSDCFVVEDWNNDGLNDVLVARDANGYLMVNYLINRNHYVEKSEIIISNSGEYYSIEDITRIENCDFNNDGFMDLYIQRESHGYILTNRNNTSFIISHVLKNLSRVQLKDFNNDGYTDLIAYNSGNQSIESYINNQNGDFEIAFFNFDKVMKPTWIRSDDMDGDGDVDIIIGVDENQPLADNHSRTEKVSEIWVFSNQIIEMETQEKEELPIPDNLRVEVDGSNARFSWEQNSQLSNIKYNIYLKNEKGDYLISSVTSLEDGADYSRSGYYWSNSNFFHTTCLESGTYRWGVQTLDKDGRTSPFSEEQTLSFVQPALTKPEAFRVDVLSPTEINLYWNTEDKNVEFFEIQRKTEGEMPFETIGLLGLNETFYPEIELSSNTSYSYRMRAYNCTNESEFTETITVHTPPYIFTPHKKYPIMISSSSKPKLADFDNNGKIDFINKNNNRLEIYYGVNDTVTSPEYLDLTPLANLFYSSIDYQLLDFDKNGYLDIMVPSESKSANDTVIIYGFMNSGEAFTLMQLDTINLQSFSSFYIDDLNNDGNWDYYGNFLLDGWNSSASIILNNGNTRSRTTLEGHIIDCEHLVDLDQDGYKDIPLSIGNSYDESGKVQFVSYSPITEWQTKDLYNNLWTQHGTLYFEFTDWNNDGWMDILTLTYSDEERYQLSVLENNKGLSFEMLSPNSDVALDYEPFLNVMDINGDDISDAILSGHRLNTYQNGEGNWVMLSDLSNNFLSVQGPDLLSFNYISYTNLADLDGDGDPELIVYNDDSYGGNAGIEIFNNNFYPSYTDEWRKPMPPVQLKQQNYGESGSILSWENSSNEMAGSLYYNVQIVNEAGATIISAESLDSGQRQIQNYGNCGINKFFIVPTLPIGNYTWKVQAINKSKNASAFSEEAIFTQELMSGIDNISVQPLVHVDRTTKTITLDNQFLPAHVKIFDLQGRVLYNQKTFSTLIELKLADHPNFIIIELTANNKVYHYKTVW
jgi:hypothetical protein